MKNKNYGILNIELVDNLIEKKRAEMLDILNQNIEGNNINSFLDIGTTEETTLKSSNYFLNKFQNIPIKKTISFFTEVSNYRLQILIRCYQHFISITNSNSMSPGAGWRRS